MTTLLCLRTTKGGDVWQAISTFAQGLAGSGRTVLINLLTGVETPSFVATPVPDLVEAFGEPFADMDSLVVPTNVENLWYAELKSPVENIDEADFTGNLIHLDVDYIVMAMDPIEGPMASAVVAATDYVIPCCGEGERLYIPAKFVRSSIASYMVAGRLSPHPNCSGVPFTPEQGRDVLEKIH